LALSALLLSGYCRHATRARYPLLQLGLFHLRTFRAAVAGSFSRALRSAASRFCCRCCSRWASATTRRSPGCW
jgi:hypothetical protein